MFVPQEDPLPIANWVARVLRTGATPYIFGFSSAVVRLCDTAYKAGLDFQGAQFLMGGEPITTARLEAVRRTGAEGIPRYGSIETGPVGYSCLKPESPDDVHLLRDLHAVIQPDSEREKKPGRALFITSLLPTAPFILLNVSMGDQALLTKRSCGCPMENLGWHTHLQMIRSYEKLTAGGMTLLDTDIIRVLEEKLPARFGGSPTHYQLVETEKQGQPQLTLLVHPVVSQLDLDEISEVFLNGIGARPGSLWHTPGFFSVDRRPPLPTGSGKILHLHVERPF
jgi:hypothetical protein